MMDTNHQADLAADLEATARGDEMAFRRLWDAAAPTLLGLCVHILRRRAAAEDVLQESFVRIWRKAHRYDRTLGCPQGWMAAVARNAALDHLRRERGRGETSLEEHEHAPIAEEDLLPEGLDLSASDLGRCLKGLPATQRRAILLAYYRGMTHAELADVLAVPLGTAKSWVRRGLIGLKECLER
jgi:RNA polymerase sigma-70 factor (ECF subfamily)